MDFLKARFQCLCIPHDTECVQQNTIHLHLSVWGKFGQKGFFGTGHIGGADCFPAGSFRSDLSSIDRTQKRISTQTVCAMVLSAAFTGSVQIPHRSAVPLVHLNTAHKVMDTRQNRNGFFANIFVQIGLTIIHQSGKFMFHNFLGELCHIKEHLIVTADRPDFPRGDVTRHQVAEFRIFFFHEVPRLPVP